MQNARTPHRLIRLAAAGLAGAAALLSPLADVAGAELSPSRDLPTGEVPVRVDVNPFAVRAGTVTSKNGVLTIDAATNSRNDIWLVGDGLGGHLVDDSKAPLVPGAGCFTLHGVFAKPVIRCTGAVHLVVRMGLGDDEAFVSAGAPVTTDIDAGSGNDLVTTENSSDYISGGYGVDRIKAGGGDDVLIGGDDYSFDRLDGGAGSDDCYQGESYMNCDNGVLNDDAIR